jgi:malate dehydrogenase (oxaloacetate-decarboxylating)(NADP+)
VSTQALDKDLVSAALEYHRNPTPGKISVVPTKALINQRDLALAYSPGVAAACEAIVADPAQAAGLTSRGNLVGVITNGTAVLGLGNIGPLAAKPVMEGKACLFKKFAGIDVFDIELAEDDPDKLIDMIVALEPTLGGVNLEDIKAPECFYIERKVRERMKIPVFHDDQHGTAIISTAALLNGLKVVAKDIGRIKLACSGAGAAAIACLDLMVRLGVRRENIFVCDSKGVIFVGREKDLEPNKARYAQETDTRELADIVAGADVFLGCSTAGVLTGEMVKTMAPGPLILALANPVPEILPDVAKAARPDCIVATGRSDFPNQVNNVLCFPFLFRGALDVGATRVTEEMKLACVYAIADLAHAEPSELVARAYGSAELAFGPEYIIPKPFDPSLILKIAPAVARAAMESGVATRPIADFDAYHRDLTNFVYHSGTIMRPVFAAARDSGRRVVYAEGEDERVLRAARAVLDEHLARPILIGRPSVIEMRIRKTGVSLQAGRDFEVVNPESDPRFRDFWSEYYRIMSRKGVTPAIAQAEIRRNPTLIGAMLLRRGEADALVAGPSGLYAQQLKPIADVIGLSSNARLFASLSLLILPKRTLFITDPYVNDNPDAEDIAAITVLAAAEVRRFGLTPRVALLSHSSFGSAPCASSTKMRRAREILAEVSPDLEADGEMKADQALVDELRAQVHPDSKLSGPANLLVMPNMDAANISLNLLKAAQGDGITVGPILLGAAKSVHILTPSASVRRIVNITALAAAQAAGRPERVAVPTPA